MMEVTRRARTVFPLLLAMTFAASIALLPVPSARAARSCLYFEFVKNTNINSTIYWRYLDDYGRCLLYTSYRAGSGDITDPCQQDHGWLPNGWYGLTSEGHIHDKNGTLIKGRVWALEDKACSVGTVRTQLYIHTEETRTNTQTCTSASDDPWRWDATAAPGGGTGSNDYLSAGCIKVRRNSPEGSWPNNLGSLDSDWHNLGPGGQQPGRTDTVWVHS